ncbi:hypothetical protein LguiB_005718 [Lonicera macranthoides]
MSVIHLELNVLRKNYGNNPIVVIPRISAFESQSCPRGLHCKDEIDVASTSLLITLVRVFSQIEDAEDILWVVKAITARLIDCKVDQEQSCDCEPMRRACVWAISLADRPNKTGKMEGVTTMRQGADAEDIWHVRNLHDGMRKFCQAILPIVASWQSNNISSCDAEFPTNIGRVDKNLLAQQIGSNITGFRPVIDLACMRDVVNKLSSNSKKINPLEHFKTNHGYFIHPQGSKELVGSLETKWKTTNQYLLKEHAWLQCTRRCMFALVPQLNNLLMKVTSRLSNSKSVQLGRVRLPGGNSSKRDYCYALKRSRVGTSGEKKNRIELKSFLEGAFRSRPKTLNLLEFAPNNPYYFT